MPAQGVETISLNLDGNFAAKAKEDAAAGNALAGSLDRLAASSAGIKPPALGDAGAGIKGLGASSAGIKAIGADAKRTAAEIDKLKASSASPFGPLAPPKSDKVKEKEKAFDLKFRAAEAADAGSTLAKGAEAGKGSMSSGSEAIKGAARYLGEKGVDFALSGARWAADVAAGALKAGVEQSAAAQKQTAILDKLTGGQGELAFKMAMSLGGATGVAPEVAIERLKGLIGAKFSQEEIPLLFSAAADLGEVKGAEKGKTFLEQLEKTQAKGKATEESINGLAEAGISAESVLLQLAQKGEGLDKVRARLKAGEVSAKDFALAASAAVSKDFGGIAGKGLDAMWNRAKIGAVGVLSGFDLSPLDALGSKLDAAFAGDSGAELKKQISAAGSAVVALAGNITAADIKGAFEGIASAASTMAKGVGDAAEFAGETFKAWKEFSGANADEADTIERQIKLQTDKAQQRYDREQKAKAAAEIKPTSVDASPGVVAGGTGKGDATAGGIATGAALAAGMKKGVDDNAGLPAAATAAMVAGAIKAGDQQAQIKSPSRVMGTKGGYLAEGLEGGIDDNADKPARAAADMMRKTVRAGDGVGSSPGFGGSGASGGQGSSSGPPVVINVAVQATPGMTTGQASAIGDAAGSAAYLAWQAHKRRDARDAQEAVA